MDKYNIPYQNIILIGMPAVGKSTLGVVLAKRMGFGVVDTDLLIQSGENNVLSGIILDIGMERFCDLEATYILQLAHRQTVIATGGSVVYRASAMKHLKNLGCIVFLDIQLSELAKRLKALDARGVVHQPGQTMDGIYAERRPLYQHYADIRIDCTRCSVDQTLKKVLVALRSS